VNTARRRPASPAHPAARLEPGIESARR
jgi:hypothetical protein